MVSSTLSYAQTIVLVCSGGSGGIDPYFKLTRNCCEQLSFSAKKKCTAAMRILALGTVVHVVGEMVRMGKNTCLKTIVNFSRVVVEVFGAEYLREPNVHDTERLLAIRGERGFLGTKVQLIACISNGRAAPKVCAGCTKVIPKRPLIE